MTVWCEAALHGRDLAERARSLIAIAAPAFREPLERAAYKLHVLLRGGSFS